MSQGEVRIDKEGGVAHITFSHPAHNALPGYLLSALAEGIKSCGASAEINLIILKSQGDRTFCAGASFDELMAISDERQGKAFFSGFADVINACRTCPNLIIGRVQGKAVGGGVGLAAACDITYATKYAAVKLSELAVGIGPFVVGPAVERKMGLSAFSQLAIDATRWQNAYWAKDHGLYAEVFDQIKEMDERIEELSTQLVRSSPEAMMEMKKMFWKGTEDWGQLLQDRAVISGRLVLSPFSKNAISKFKQK